MERVMTWLGGLIMVAGGLGAAGGIVLRITRGADWQPFGEVVAGSLGVIGLGLMVFVLGLFMWSEVDKQAEAELL